MNSGTPAGAAAITSSGGRSGGALSLDGTAGTWMTGESGVLDTTRSFTASVWVNLSETTGDRVALAVEGSTNSAFAIL